MGEVLHAHIRIPGEPRFDLALEAELLARAGKGRVSALASSWPQPVVVLGYGQPAEDVDLAWCRREGLPVLRRLTGGTGVVHRHDLGFALFLPADHPWCRSVVGLYGRFLDVLAPVIERHGGPLDRGAGHAPRREDRSAVCFEDRLADTLMRDGRKVVGCAQARRSGGVLIHAAILFGLPVDLYARVFGADPERIRAHLGPAVEGGDPLRLARELIEAFAREVGARAEIGAAPAPRPSALERFDTPRWAPVRP